MSRGASIEPWPQVITLKNGEAGVLRRVRLDDAQGIFDLERECVMDGRGVVRGVEDLHPDADGVRKGLRHWTDPARDYGCMLVVEPRAPRADGVRILGVGDFRRLRPARVHHVAQVSLEVHPAAQRLGVGRAIMASLMDWARGVGINRVQLNVIATNDRAIALYTSMGFEVVGNRRRMIRHADGTECDDLEMGILLDETPDPR